MSILAKFRSWLKRSRRSGVARTPLRVEELESRQLPSAPVLNAIADQTMSIGQDKFTLALSASDADGDSLSFSGRVLGPQAYELDCQLGLSYLGSYYTNYHGAQDKWMQAKNGDFYGLFPNGDLRKWLGSIGATFSSSGLVANLGPGYYEDPSLLWNAASAPVVLRAKAYELDYQLGLSYLGTYYTNYHGAQDKWMQAQNGDFYGLFPNGDLRKWLGTIGATLNSQGLVASMGPDFYADPSLLWGAVKAYELDSQLNLSFLGSYYTNYHGAQDKWVSSQNGDFYGLFPNGDVRQWQGTIGATLSSQGLVATLGPSFYADPSLLWSAANPPPVVLTFSGNQLTVDPPAGYAGSFGVEVTVSDGTTTAVRTFSVTVANTAPVFNVIADQTMSTGQDQLTVTVSASDADGDALTYAGRVRGSQAYELDYQLGLSYMGTYYTNYHGAQDKWMQAQNGDFYGLFPNGEVRKWLGDIAATLTSQGLVATLDPSYYADPSLLWNAAPSPVALSMSGNQLTVDPPAGYAGSFVVEVNVCDGTTTIMRTFTVTVANGAPSNLQLTRSAAAINENGSVNLNGTFSDTGDAGSHTVVITWGDGQSSSLNLTAGVFSFSTTHQYRDNPSGQPNGSFAINVTVSDNSAGQTSGSTTAQVNNVAPTAGAGGPYSGVAGTAIAFNAMATDPSTVDTTAGFTYAWNFGDGTTGTQAAPSHTYAAAGTYTVTLIVTDKDGGAGTGSANATVSASAPTDPNDQLAKPVLSHSNFSYIGSFRMPTSANDWSTAYAMGGLTHRYVNGNLQFLTTSHVYSDGLVYETNYPGVSTSGSPQAQVVREWGDVYDGHRWVGNTNGGLWTYGLYYDENLDRLYWNYGHWYNATNPYNPSFGYSVLDDSTGVATGIGAWSLTDRPEKFARGGTTRIPKWFADGFTGGKSLGVGFGGYFSIVSTASDGPALAAVSDPDITVSPDRSSLANVPLIGYPHNPTAYTNPERVHRDTDYHTEYDGWQTKDGTGYWTWSDIIYGGGSWIDMADKQGVLFIAKVGQGRVWYENSDRHAERGSFEWFVYDPNDLAAVATGAKQQWEIQPKYTWIDSALPIPDVGGWKGDGGNQVGGITFDATNNRLYVLVNGVWNYGREWYPQVYVYQVG